MQKFLDVLLAARFPSGVGFKVIPHEGKGHLKQSIPIKLRVLNKSGVTFIVLIDQDSSDCLALKNELDKLCRGTGANYKVRIVCRELEAWYLGDLSAVDKAFSTNLSKHANRESFRDPDILQDAKRVLKTYIGQIGQIETAERIARAMVQSDFRENKSRSFHMFLKTVGLDR